VSTPHAFPSIERIADHQPAPSPGISAARPLLTWRVVVRDTGRALRLGFEANPRVGRPAQYPDQIAEFTSEDQAGMALWHIVHRTPFGLSAPLAVEACVHAGVDARHEVALFCRVRDSAYCLALAEWRLEDNRRRSLAGLEPAAKRGWSC
jgi:hypothetical protein